MWCAATSDEDDTTDGSDDEVYHKSSSAAHRVSSERWGMGSRRMSLVGPECLHWVASIAVLGCMCLFVVGH